MWGGWLVGGGRLLLLLLLLPPYYTQTLHPKPSTLNNTGKYLEKVISSLIKIFSASVGLQQPRDPDEFVRF